MTDDDMDAEAFDEVVTGWSLFGVVAGLFGIIIGFVLGWAAMTVLGWVTMP